MSIFSKIRFLFKKPRVIIVAGKGKEMTKEAIFQVLKQDFKIERKDIFLNTDFANIESFKFLLRNSSQPVLVANHVENLSSFKELVKLLPAQGILILNSDDGAARELKTWSLVNPLTFGFQAGADFQATDLKLNQGVNFKLNYKGNIVPVWLERAFNKEDIYSFLAGISLGVISDLNLIEISQSLKEFKAEGVDSHSRKS
jgi:hypothetical protein